ncbi:putative sporulation lipoprotein, YhcN/YlaJ-like protein [Gottschalkia acidurici 9a]|uniref:Sporulation lipoprotein, YhcN/YlaJ-like protein n=1 Tax=Gottschalkia acidurici (strain ATCC 7906 / DSM 604 / BCRC 14475 / CIP 104303 / KCTC 5404 / NCIMB 10678 / 9a) TaxID=1128398 RepID=K0B002_GOTA9|nr:YhcN/YlaJ family sporulation lipoprotein [Gottschalkia acidurici]AFS78300.1 putative sporulation lipoprotein, YhcN/YlaJ-like protein [Gottschalkia acidurici 9a]
MKKILILVMSLVIGLATIGCNQSPKKVQQENNKSQNETQQENSKNMNTESTQEKKRTIHEGALKGESIADKLVMEKGIADASVIVLENEALVAVILSEGETMTKQITDKIKEIVKSSDKNINKIAITQDKDMFFKVDSMAQTMMKEERPDSIKTDFDNTIKNIGIESI